LGLLSDSAVPPVSVYTDGHYTTLVNTDRVVVEEHKLVEGFVRNQSERCFQHFRVRVARDDAPVSIINCHAPASKKRGLTVDGRMRYFQAFHTACAADRFIWGGDFNTGVIQLTALVQSIDARYAVERGGDSSAAQPGSLQIVFSHPLRFKHGDIAVTYGLCSVQVNSKVGNFYNGASDAHDLVVVKAFGKVVPPGGPTASASSDSPQWPMPTRPVPQPPHAARSSSSAAQPAPQELRLPPPPLPPQHAARSSSSVAQPAAQDLPLPPPPKQDVSAPSSATEPAPPIARITATQPHLTWSEAPKREEDRDEYSYTYTSSPVEPPSSAAQPAPQRPWVLRPATPRVNEIFGTDDAAAGPLQELLEKISKDFLFGKVANIVATATGCYEVATSPHAVAKLEAFLQIVQEQRALHLRRHPDLAADVVFPDKLKGFIQAAPATPSKPGETERWEKRCVFPELSVSVF
jgi:hypothetical protein